MCKNHRTKIIIIRGRKNTVYYYYSCYTILNKSKLSFGDSKIIHLIWLPKALSLEPRLPMYVYFSEAETGSFSRRTSLSVIKISSAG